MALTEGQKFFLASQWIAESEVLDASRMSPRSYKAAMKYEGKLFALVSRPCYDGHYLKSRSGHCIQCHTARSAGATLLLYLVREIIRESPARGRWRTPFGASRPQCASGSAQFLQLAFSFERVSSARESVRMSRGVSLIHFSCESPCMSRRCL